MNLRPHRSGLLAEAEALCRDVLGDAPARSAVLHLGGLLAGRRGQDDVAVALLMQAAALVPADVQFQMDLGDALARGPRLDLAAGAYLRAITIEPTRGALYRTVAQTLLRKKQLLEALAVADEAMRLEPDDARSYHLAGSVLQALGRWPAALAAYERATQLDPCGAGGCAGLGQVYLHQQAWKLAADSFRRGLERVGDLADLHVGFGSALLRLGLPAEAAEAFNSALAIDPAHARAAQQLVFALELTGNTDELVGAWCALGAAFAISHRYEDAAAAYREAVARKPDCLRALVRLGHLYGALAKPAEAMRCYEKALAIKPDHSRVHRGLGWAHLVSGAFAKGWQETARDQSGIEAKQRDFEQPTWDGSAIKDETLLVWADQGLGDTIQFLRYLPLARACCRRLLVECSSILLPFFKRLPCVDRITVARAPLPHFDQQVTFHGLARVFETRGLTLSKAVPYLPVCHDAVDAWRHRVTCGATRPARTVGLVWAGEPERKDGSLRFIPLSAFAPLAAAPRLRLVSLQLGAPGAELLATPDGLRIDKILDDTCSILDTAAAVLNLDLIITIDTMMAHLAGALGKPVWLLLPFAAEWRWEVDGNISRWYPTMRLFRQQQSGDWQSVVGQVLAALGMASFSS